MEHVVPDLNRKLIVLGHVLKEKFCAVMDLVCQHIMNMDVTIIALLNVLKMNNFVLDKLDMTITKDMNMIEIFMIMEIVLNQIFAFIKIISAQYFVERRKFFAQDHTNTMKDMIMLKTMKDMDMTMEIMTTKTMKDMTTTGMNTIMIMIT